MQTPKGPKASHCPSFRARARARRRGFEQRYPSMRQLQKLSILFILFLFPLFGEEKYPINPYVDPSVWKAVTPYFLPIDDPIKPVLDKIFKKARVTTNKESLEKAGFRHVRDTSYSLITVAVHPKLSGYLFKFYTDNVDRKDWSAWIKRIEGAKSIKRAIKQLKYEKHFTVPQKWIYPLPADPSPLDNGIQRKNFILIVEDMEILPGKGNRAQWRGPFMTYERLDAIFTIVEREGLSDSTCSNLPFNHKGKQSFIDTERHHHWPVPYGKIMPYLSTDKQEYLLQLIHGGEN